MVRYNNGRSSRSDRTPQEAIVASFALCILLLICVLACFTPSAKVVLADKITFLFLAVVFTLFWSPLLKVLEAQSGGGCFMLTAAMFVVYSMARRVVPENGWSMRFAGMPDDDYIFPSSAYLVVVSAMFTSPFWWRYRNNWTRALLSGIAIVAALAGFSFWLLSRYYPVGTALKLDPSALPNLFLMLIEYSCLALLCRAVGAYSPTRRFALRVLPLLLLALWSRFHFIPTEGDA